MAKETVMLYFGSFNPPHMGHISISEWIIQHQIAQKVVLVVSPRNPFKDERVLVDEFHRFQMAQIAVSHCRFPEQISASAIEFTLPRPSYTINTLEYLQSICSDRMDFSILVGEDNIASFDSWHRAKDILSQYKIYVYPREEATHNVDPRFIYLNDAPRFNVSSTLLRKKLILGQDTKGALQKEVLDYIIENSLWQKNK